MVENSVIFLFIFFEKFKTTVIKNTTRYYRGILLILLIKLIINNEKRSTNTEMNRIRYQDRIYIYRDINNISTSISKLVSKVNSDNALDADPLRVK